MRRLVTAVGGVLLALLAVAVPAQAEERIAVAYPGPFNVPLLPLDVARAIGADRAEGIELVPRFVSGAGALGDLQSRNVDFAVPGIPAAMSARARGADVVAVMPVNALPVYQLAVRAALKDRVKRPSDLAGLRIGVTSSTGAAKTTSHQVAELLLKQDGVPAARQRIVAIGQSWEEVRAAVDIGAVDAVIGFEPFPGRLADEGLAHIVFDLANPRDAVRVPGAGFLLAGLVTRSDVIAQSPEKVGKVVAVVRRTLLWMAEHSPEEIVAALPEAAADKRAALVASLRRYPHQYSPDGRFSQRQIDETNRFFAATGSESKPVPLAAMLDARWAGSKP